MLEYFEKELEKSLLYYQKDDDLFKAFKYSLESGGKRIRPILVLLVAKSLGKDYRGIVDLAIAIEYIHNYSLVHDDLPGMDNDSYRRGKLTTHKKFGHFVGILTGDALLTEAFSVVARSKKLENKDGIIICLTECIGMKGMIYGQYLDMLYENKKIDINTLKLIHKNKTGALIRACFNCVLINYGIQDEKYLHIADLLGLIYQLQDDVFDSDNKEDKSNFVNILGYEKTIEILNKYIDELKSILPKGTELEEFILKILGRQK